MQALLETFGVESPRYRGSAANTNSLLKVSTLLRRRVGNEIEDMALDRLQRVRDAHIFSFSMAGILMMVVMSSFTWYNSCKNIPDPGDDCYKGNTSVTPSPYPVAYRKDTYFDEAIQSDANVAAFISILQVFITVSTIITICLICHKYYLQLNIKRSLWSGLNWADVESMRNKTKSPLWKRFSSAYDLFQSTMKWDLFLEVAIHVPHPIFFIKRESETLFEISQILMFLRLYLLFGLAHHYSPAYRSRIEIVSSNHELSRTNFKIDTNITSKMIFYEHTGRAVLVLFLLSIALFGFCMFVVERKNEVLRNDPKFFGKLENCFWFIFVTFSTIGYGDLFPMTTIGRIIAVLASAGGIYVQNLFGGVVTNRVAKTSEQKTVEEYINRSKAEDNYEVWAAILIQRVYREYVAHMAWKLLPKKKKMMWNKGQMTWYESVDRSLHEDAINVLKEDHTAEEMVNISKRAHFDAPTNDARRTIKFRHKGNLILDALLQLRNARRELDYARLQAKDTIVDQHISQVCEVIDVMMESTQKTRHKLEMISAGVESRMVEIENLLKKKKRL
eukprot:PhF_6_TR30400/c0_g1_i2/m.44573